MHTPDAVATAVQLLRLVDLSSGKRLYYTSSRFVLILLTSCPTCPEAHPRRIAKPWYAQMTDDLCLPMMSRQVQSAIGL